jgi:hypothetical protein
VNQALAKRSSDQIATEGTFANAHKATEALREAMEHYNLVSPATSCGDLPEGCAIALSRVLVSEQADTYNLSGKRGLSKSILQKIGHAAGVSWDPIASGRIDDGSHPHYCRFRAVGRYKSFDGQVQTIVAEKELDLRNGSATCVALDEQQKRKGANADGQIREMRQHIQSHAETKAQLRALRSLGIKTAYTSEELKKPFVVARVMFTGHSDDPATARMFKEKIADSFLGAQASLYGGGVPMQSAQRMLPPPPVNRTRPDSGEYEVDADDLGETSASHRGDLPEQREEKREPARAAAPAAAAGGAGDGGKKPKEGANPDFVLRFGRSKDRKIRDAKSEDLEWMRDTVEHNLESGNSRFPDNDRKLLAAVKAELEERGEY